MNLSGYFRRSTRYAASIAFVLIAGCSTTKPAPPSLSFDLPATFLANHTPGYTPAESWWRDFKDAQLNSFVGIALERSPALAQAIARARMAEAQLRLTQADRLPQLGVAAGSTRQRQNLGPIQGAADNGTILSTTHQATLDVSWELDLWGRLASMSSAARSDYLASRAQLTGMRQSIAAQVVREYFDIVHARAQVELSERTVASLSEMARQITNRVNVGIASPVDGMLASANQLSAQAGLEQRRETLERGLRRLEILMGDYPSGRLQTASTLAKVPPPPAAGVPAALLARRPDVRAAEQTLLGAGYRLTAAERSFLPTLSLTGAAGYGGSELSNLFSSGNLLWSIAGRLLQPIFQGGRLVAQVQIAEGQQDEALHAYAETALTALAEVETALAVDGLLAKREQALAASADSAGEAVGVSYRRYMQGIDPFLNVLESQQRALDGRMAHITSHHARIQNRIALHLALGGDFDAPGGIPVSSTDTPQ